MADAVLYVTLTALSFTIVEIYQKGRHYVSSLPKSLNTNTM